MSQLFGIFSNFVGVRAFSNNRKKKLKQTIIQLPIIKSTVISSNGASVFGNDFQKVMNFLNRVSSVLGVTIPRPEAVETTKNVSHALYEVLAHNQLKIPEKFKFILKDEYSKSLDNLTFFARAKSITEAKQRALFNLAESLYTILKSADIFMPNIDQDPKKVLPFIKFDISEDDKQNLRKLLEECDDFLEKNQNFGESEIKNQNISKRSYVSSDPKTVSIRRPEPLHGKLPIYRHYREIVQSIDKNQVTIISATTGSGKTTQIPKFILHHFEAERPSIIVTQPRRVAAISLANRLAHELGDKSVGQSVGYSVRFDSILPNYSKSNILFCTSGLLIKKLQMMNDEVVLNCSHLILDEIHERDISTDILLLAVRRLLGINSKLKVVIMSATLDATKFHSYFSEPGNLKVGDPIRIETDTNFPVAQFHLEDVIGLLKRKGFYPTNISALTRQFVDKELGGEEALPETIPNEIISHMAKLLHETKPEGSILCFLPGWEDIVTVKNELEQIMSRSSKAYKIYCIHSSAPPEVAQSIFYKTEGERKIILATNIAESSITIPDVAYVIDSGKQKINMFNAALRMNSLKTTWISKSNSLQRLGRVGRTQPGEYYLMCSRIRQLSPNLPPEILRIGLEDVCLSIKGLGFEGKCRDIASELLDKPNKIALRDAVNRLIQLDALEPETENITELGKILSSIPLNPSLGKSLVLAHVLGCSKEMLTFAAGVGERILRVPRFEHEKEQFLDFVRNLRNFYEDDHQLLLNLYEKFQQNELPKLFNTAEMKFISTLSLKRIGKVRQSLEMQLKHLLPKSGVALSENASQTSGMSKFLALSAFYPDIAFKLGKRNHYLLPGGISAESQKESMQYTESLETVLAKHPEGVNCKSFVPAKALIFEELFDAGHSMIVKSSIVDPIYTVLFADSVLVLHKTIYVDNWIRITAEKEDSLMILLELRRIWKSMSRHVLSDNNGKVANLLRELLNMIAGMWDIQREVVIKQ